MAGRIRPRPAVGAPPPAAPAAPAAPADPPSAAAGDLAALDALVRSVFPDAEGPVLRKDRVAKRFLAVADEQVGHTEYTDAKGRARKRPIGTVRERMAAFRSAQRRSARAKSLDQAQLDAEAMAQAEMLCDWAEREKTQIGKQ